jgi:hypothetical protein
VAEKRRRGRPPLPARPQRVRIHLWLRPGEDDDLIAFFRQVPLGRRPSAIKTALRTGGMQSDALTAAGEDDDQDFAATFLN